MAVAKNQIDELVECIARHIPADKIPALCTDLLKTEAGRKNISFSTTISRIGAHSSINKLAKKIKS